MRYPIGPRYTTNIQEREKRHYRYMHWREEGLDDNNNNNNSNKSIGRREGYGQKLKLCVDANTSAKPLMSIAGSF